MKNSIFAITQNPYYITPASLGLEKAH